MRKIHCRSQNLSWLTLKYHYFKIPEIQSMYLRRGFTLVRIYELSYVFADLAESAVAICALTATCAAPIGGALILDGWRFFLQMRAPGRTAPHLVIKRPAPGRTAPDHACLLPPATSLLPHPLCSSSLLRSDVVGVDDGSMSMSLDAEPPPSAPFGRGLCDVPLAPSRRHDDASPSLYGTSMSPAAPLLDLSNLAPVKSSWSHQLRVRARVWAFVQLSDGLGVGW